MNTTLNEIVVHINESVDDAMLDTLEQGIRQDPGIVSVGHQHSQNHLMVSSTTRRLPARSSILHNFRERGLHAQLIGM